MQASGKCKLRAKVKFVTFIWYCEGFSIRVPFAIYNTSQLFFKWTFIIQENLFEMVDNYIDTL